MAYKRLSRQRRSLLANHRRAVSHGVITPEVERQHSALTLLEEEDGLVTLESQHSRQSTRYKDRTDSITSTGRGDSASISRNPSKKRINIFRKLIHH